MASFPLYAKQVFPSCKLGQLVLSLPRERAWCLIGRCHVILTLGPPSIFPRERQRCLCRRACVLLTVGAGAMALLATVAAAAPSWSSYKPGASTGWLTMVLMPQVLCVPDCWSSRYGAAGV